MGHLEPSPRRSKAAHRPSLLVNRSVATSPGLRQSAGLQLTDTVDNRPRLEPCQQSVEGKRRRKRPAETQFISEAASAEKKIPMHHVCLGVFANQSDHMLCGCAAIQPVSCERRSRSVRTEFMQGAVGSRGCRFAAVCCLSCLPAVEKN